MADKEQFWPDWLAQGLEVDGGKLTELLTDPKTAKGKYIRLFTTPEAPRNAATIQDFIAECSNLTEYQIGELTISQIQELFQQIVDAINEQAVNPTTAASTKRAATAKATESE